MRRRNTGSPIVSCWRDVRTLHGRGNRNYPLVLVCFLAVPRYLPMELEFKTHIVRLRRQSSMWSGRIVCHMGKSARLRARFRCKHYRCNQLACACVVYTTGLHRAAWTMPDQYNRNDFPCYTVMYRWGIESNPYGLCRRRQSDIESGDQ
jgi:hypothetical protein